MKNPHGVEPTRFMKKEKSNYAIGCFPALGPCFGGPNPDIGIRDQCSAGSCGYIYDPTHLQYECHPQYQSSLFVNTNAPDVLNCFTVLDYEVFTLM